MRNVALVAKREILDKAIIVNGVTASVPAYKPMDTAGNQEWVVDVYIGPLLDQSIIYDCLITPAAKQLITDIRQPVQLERSKQGTYTVVGRAKIISAGVQLPDGSITEPNFRELEVNLAQLSILHVADLDYEAEELQPEKTDVLQATEDEPLQAITVTDAFGEEVTDEGDCADSGLALMDGIKNGKTRHVRIAMATLGPYHADGAMQWGTDGSVLQPAVQEVIELED